MKELIRNILKEETEKNKNIDRYLNPLIKYISIRPLPDYVCFVAIVNHQNLIIVLLQYSVLVNDSFEKKLQSEVNNIFNLKNIYVTGFYGDGTNCEKRLERLINDNEYNKSMFIIPNKNYNP